MEWIVVKTMFSLAAVVALMIAVVFVMKKYVYGGKSASSNLIDMKVIGTLMLQPKRSVSVLKVMNKILVIGITEDGLETLGEIDDEKSLSQVEEKLSEETVQQGWFGKKSGTLRGSSFADMLNTQLGKSWQKVRNA